MLATSAIMIIGTPALSEVKEVPLTPVIPVKIGLVWKKRKIHFISYTVIY